MSKEIKKETGTIVQIGEVQQISEKFSKRELVINSPVEFNGGMHDNFLKFQVSGKKLGIIDGYKLGDQVIVSYNIKGYKWEKDGKVNYFTNLEAWKIESINTATGEVAQQGEGLPF